MPRLRKPKIDDPSEESESVAETPATITATETPAAPVRPKIDFAVAAKEVSVKQWPDIRDGICEFCGTKTHDADGNPIPSWEQFKHCKHYQDVEIRCIYCEPGADPEDMIKGKTLHVIERSDKPGYLNVFHDTYGCTKKFYKSFRV